MLSTTNEKGITSKYIVTNILELQQQKRILQKDIDTERKKKQANR